MKQIFLICVAINVLCFVVLALTPEEAIKAKAVWLYPFGMGWIISAIVAVATVITVGVDKLFDD